MPTFLSARAWQRPGAVGDILVDAAVGFAASASASLPLPVGAASAGAKTAAATATLRPSLSFSSSSQQHVAQGAGTLAPAPVLTSAALKAGRGGATTALAATVSTGAVYDVGTYAAGVYDDAGGRAVAKAATAAAGTLGYSRTGAKLGRDAGSVSAAPTPSWVGLKRADDDGSIALAAAADFDPGAFYPGTFDPGVFHEDPGKTGTEAPSLALPPVFATGGTTAATGTAALALAGAFARTGLPRRLGAGGTAGATAALTATGTRPAGGAGTLALAATPGFAPGAFDPGTFDPGTFADNSGKVGRGAPSATLVATFANPSVVSVYDGTVYAGDVYPDEAGKIVAHAGGNLANSIHFDPDGTSLNAVSFLVRPVGVGRRTATASGSETGTAAFAATGRKAESGTGAAAIVVSPAALGRAGTSGTGAASATVGLAAPGVRKAAGSRTVVAGTPGFAADGSAEIAGGGVLALPPTVLPASKGFLGLVLGSAVVGRASASGDGADLRVGDLSLSSSGHPVGAPGAGTVPIVLDLGALAGAHARSGRGAADLGATFTAAGHPSGVIDIPPGIPLRGVLRSVIALRGRLPDPVRLTGALSTRPH